MGARLWLLLASAFGFLGVVFGAFGAHALRERLAPDLLAVYRTGVEYQFWHVAALLAVGLLATQKTTPLLNAAGASFTIGILLFSGSLYALALSGVRVLGAVTPFGGLAFLVGWALLGLAVLRS